MIPVPQTEIAARAALACRMKDPRSSGLLFHGTAEPFEGPPRPSSFDDLFWVADSPLIAQAYIPEAGLSQIVARPSDWRLSERVRPDRHSFWTSFAVTTMGRPLPDVDYDDWGMAKSWSIDPRWPTYAECLAELRGLGYSFHDGHESIRYADGPDGPVARADWLQPGRVYVTAADGLKLVDRSTGESDLGEKAHLDFAFFESARRAGADGVVIDDFAQSADCGNVGHRAIGLFASAVERLEFLVYDAVHRRMGGARSLGTPDFAAFGAGIRGADPAPAARAI